MQHWAVTTVVSTLLALTVLSNHDCGREKCIYHPPTTCQVIAGMLVCR